MNPPNHGESVASRMREGAGLTQEEAAAVVGISVRSWQRFESGKKTVPLAIVEEFCSRTGLDVEKFRVLKEEASALNPARKVRI